MKKLDKFDRFVNESTVKEKLDKKRSKPCKCTWRSRTYSIKEPGDKYSTRYCGSCDGYITSGGINLPGW